MSKAPSNLVLTELDAGVFRIVMNRPEKKNALTVQMYSDLAAAIIQAEADPEVRVMLIYGADNSFTAGNDLKDFLESPPVDENSPVFHFMKTIGAAKKPIVAAVVGHAVGIGTTMLLHCDLVYAGMHATFMLPFINLGLCPEAASSYLLPRLAGHHRAAELLLLGQPFSSELALEMGLVNEICADSEIVPYAAEQARKIADKPMSSVLVTKALLKKSRSENVQDAISEEANLLIKQLGTPEAIEALRAFLERRRTGR